MSGMGTEQRTKVKHTILAMKKCGKLSLMADIYREKLCDTIRVTIRTTVSECAADAAKDASLIPTASATIVSIPERSHGGKESKDDMTAPKSSIIEGVTSMSFDQFMECLDMIYEHVLSLLKSAAGVNQFTLEEGISFKDDDTSEGSEGGESNANSSSTPSALAAGADLSHRSISEILRLRKDTHSLITFEEMRRLWDSCLAFTIQLEKISGQKAYVLRSTLLSQAKAFVERKHEANMSSMAAALDTERWTQCDVSSFKVILIFVSARRSISPTLPFKQVSAERQTVLDRLCSGRAVLSTRDNISFADTETDKSPVATVEGKRYRVVWSCLLLIEMIMSNVACAAHFQTLATNVVGKVSELLRLFNSRATQLVLGAGAIHSSARLKSINAKHLALVTQCVGVVQSILPHVRAALMAQLPSKQQTLLADLDKIRKEYAEHHDKVLSKFVSIIGGIVEHSLISRISNTNFDKRSQLQDEANVECCPFVDGVIINTRKMHQVLVSLLPLEDLMDVFSRIFAHLDSKIPKIFLDADSDDKVQFSFPESMEGKRRLILEVEVMATTLNDLPDVRPWDFGAMKFLSRRLEVEVEDDVVELISEVVGNLNLSEVLEDQTEDIAVDVMEDVVTSEVLGESSVDENVKEDVVEGAAVVATADGDGNVAQTEEMTVDATADVDENEIEVTEDEVIVATADEHEDAHEDDAEVTHVENVADSTPQEGDESPLHVANESATEEEEESILPRDEDNAIDEDHAIKEEEDIISSLSNGSTHDDAI